MDDFVSKPIRISELTRVIRRARRAMMARAPSLDGLSLPEIETLRQLSSHEPGTFAQIIDDYLATADRLVAGIERALDAGQAEELERPAHALKGCAAQMGARRVSEIALSIEKSSKAGELERAREQLAPLHAATEAARAALSWLQKEPAIPPPAPSTIKKGAVPAA
jgi:two-component system, sensor histidine kinase and response regulator